MSEDPGSLLFMVIAGALLCCCQGSNSKGEENSFALMKTFNCPITFLSMTFTCLLLLKKMEYFNVHISTGYEIIIVFST